MSKTLIIAEKPSVATDLARVLDKQLGPFKKEKDYFESGSTVISSAVGHLVEQMLPTTAEGKSLPWKFDCLPVIPDEFELQAIDGNKARFNVLKRLLKRKDVSTVINACDAGREGELIFHYIIKLTGVSKPVKRLWMRSMTNQSILDAFGSLRDGSEMESLTDAAVCRSESDWLIGINSTRAMTAYNSKWGGFNKTPVGRVQTPTLALLVERENRIRDFVAEAYWEVHGTFGVTAGEYAGRWFDETFKKDPEKEHARAERIWDRAKAAQILARTKGKPGLIEETVKPQKQVSPLLYDLTSLQREAANRFGFSARRTLQIAQALYERHKALTYPRTDSRYLPEDYLSTLKKTLSNLSDAGAKAQGVAPHAATALKNEWVKLSKRIFNNTKVSDHFAIVPTGQIPSTLSDVEQRIYQMVCQRTVAIFFPSAEWELTTRITRIEEDAFRTSGKVLKFPGWLAVYGKEAEGSGEEDGGEGDSATLVPAESGETAQNTEMEVQDKDTRPPARFNEATLLSGMETAGKLVDDEELRDAMSERGLGTPATRASIIEGLINDKYVTRDGREFIVNNRGLRLIEQLQKMKIDLLASPEMTGEWEYKLKEMESNRFPRSKFMSEIRDLTKNVVQTTKDYAQTALDREFPPFQVPCPQCGTTELAQDDGMFKCKNPECKFKLSKVVASRPLDEAEAKELLTTKFLSPRDGFLNRFRQPFAAALELIEEKNTLKVKFIFEKSEEELAEAEAVKESGHKLCPCPVCEKGDIYETPTSFVCSERVAGDGCKARLSREMCKYEIPREQALKFFNEGQTDLIDQFISKKNRPFSAHLVCDKKGKRLLQWKFPPREAKSKTATKKAAKKKTAAKKATKKAAKKNPKSDSNGDS
jgi:DNA topoisomerase-3